jgi:hypothetical protein
VSRLFRENVGASTSTTLWAFMACYRDSFFTLWYYIVLHVLAPKDFIRRYNLTNIFKLVNCGLYRVSYNLNAYYYIYLVSNSVNNTINAVQVLVALFLKTYHTCHKYIRMLQVIY